MMMMEATSLLLLCLTGLVTSMPKGPAPDDALKSLVKRQSGMPAMPLPPGENGEFVEPPMPTYGGARLGMRCQFPPNEEGKWPNFCYDVIGDRCQCMNDDMHFSMEQCVEFNGLEFYNSRIDDQLELEQQRDRERVEDGGESDPAEYVRVLNCRYAAHEVHQRLVAAGTITQGVP